MVHFWLKTTEINGFLTFTPIPPRETVKNVFFKASNLVIFSKTSRSFADFDPADPFLTHFYYFLPVFHTNSSENDPKTSKSQSLHFEFSIEILRLNLVIFSYTQYKIWSVI